MQVQFIKCLFLLKGMVEDWGWGCSSEPVPPPAIVPLTDDQAEKMSGGCFRETAYLETGFSFTAIRLALLHKYCTSRHQTAARPLAASEGELRILYL